MYAQLLEKDFAHAGTAQSIEMFRRMNLQINKLTFLITDLLDATRIEAGKFQYKNSWFDFNGLVSEVVSETQSTSRKHTIEVVLAKTLDFFGDKDRLASVITNLLSNAIKYSPDEKKIVVKTIRRKGHIILSVQDFGIGISRSNRKKIFTKFFRLHGLDEDLFGGLGLGLFISAEIVNRHGGIISVDGNKGVGSVFSFSLPVPGKVPPSKKPGKSIAFLFDQ
ncbi:MAG: HAMP domain-containing sensor histidine kinase [Ginsengibacter sp.]